MKPLRNTGSKMAADPIGPPLSRRNLLLLMAGAGVSVPLASLLTGCGSGHGNITVPATGGGNGGVTTGSTRTTGKVTLPTGSTIAMDSVKLTSGYGPANLGSDGRFSLDQFSSDPTLLVLTDTSEQPLLLGFSGSSGSVGEVSAAQTAIALVFYALGVFTLPAEDQQKVRAFLAADDRVKALGNQIAGQLAANPLALAQSDPALTGPVTTLRETLFPTTARHAPESRSLKTRDTVAATLISVDPGDEVEGFRAAPNADGLGMTITNTRRRNALLYVYETAYLDQNDTRHSPVDHKVAEGKIVWATSGLAGVVGSLVDYANGTVAYGPVTGGPYSLDLFPSGDATRSEYNIDIIGNGYSEIPLDVATEHPDYDAARAKVTFITFGKDILLPAVATFVGMQSSLKLDLVNGDAPGVELLKAYDDLAVILSGVVDSGVAISQESVRSLLIGVLKALGNNGTLRQKFIYWLFSTYAERGFDQSVLSTVAGAFASALNAVVILVDKLLGAADLGAVLADWGRSQSYTRFTAKVIAPKVRINPASGTVNVGESITLNAVTSADAPLITYHWEVSSGLGTMRNPASGLTGKALDSASPAIQYVSDSNAKDGDKVTIQMEAFLGGVNDPNRKSIGKAQSFLTLSLTKDKALPVTDQIFIDFIGSTTDAGTAAICSSFPLDSKAKSYSVTLKSATTYLNRTVLIQQSDIGDPYPEGAGFYPPKQYEVKFTGVSGMTDYDKFYRVGDTIVVPHSNVSWGPNWSVHSHEEAAQQILSNWPVWQYSLDVVAHY